MIRGCLWVVGLAAAVLAVAAWLLGPALAGDLVDAALGSAGFRAASHTVQVVADPPFELLIGRATEVQLEAAGATFGSYRAATVDVTVDGVDLLGRRFTRIDALLTGVTVPAEGTTLTLARVSIAGPAGVAAASADVPTSEIGGLIRTVAGRSLPVAPTGVTLTAPDLVTISAGPLAVHGRLAIDPTGRLLLEPVGTGILALVLFDPASSTSGLRLTAVRVTAGGIALDGTLDASGFLP